jgi:hypothetical protein
VTVSWRGLILALGCLAGVAAGIHALAATPIACPPGAVRVEARPPAGLEEWCERRDPAGTPVRHGAYRAFYPGGRLKVEGQFDEGLRVGGWTYWHGNGIGPGRGQKKEEGEYRAGREHGRWTRWHSLGPRREEGEYRQGVRQGRWTFWSELGQILREGEYRDGQEVGVWRAWSPSGTACPPEDRGAPAPLSDGRAGVSA